MIPRGVFTRRRWRSGVWPVAVTVWVCGALGPRAAAAQPRPSTSTTVSADQRTVSVTAALDPARAEFHPSRVLVRFRAGARLELLPGSGAVRRLGATSDVLLVDNAPGLSVMETLRRYRSNPNLLYAEPDYIVRTIATPTDPRWSEQWDMTKIAAPAAWDSQVDASDVVVAVIDTGIDYGHPDLQGNLWTNPSDGGHGFTCMNGTCVSAGGDDHGHGTHVAGTIGAVPNNGIGIAGINWNVQLLSLKFLGSGGSGYISDAVLCFKKVTELRQQGIKIRVTSNSWGGGGYSQALKDAMSETEAAAVVNVCAAGNSGQNADATPMYPAAYDNRGIISVLATDASDLGASFTNYGLASVDIAAPGVKTLSTVPTGPCSLCDPSGYKLLSGTSMATPHVSGVLAALFHVNSSLSAYQARDVVLDPASYDALSDTRARSTSTGGRLNFAKALTNPLLFAPVLNNFPTVTVGSNVFASAGAPVTLTATAADPDNDPLRMAWAKSSAVWLFGWMLNSLFPSPSGSVASFTAPAPARTATMGYLGSVADDRGGGDSQTTFVTVAPVPSPGLPPSGNLTVSPTDAAVGSTVAITFPAADPEGGQVAWDLWVGMKNSASGFCCYTGSTAGLTFNSAGVYRVSAQAIDRELNLSNRPSAVVRIGSAAGEPPIANATLDKLDGPVPLIVNVDMSGSSDPDGAIQWYFFNCGGGGFTQGTQTNKGTCTFDKPGTYWMLLQVMDTTGNMDLVSAYAVATPVPDNGGDTTPPTVSIASPTSGSTVSGAVSITADASDASGIAKVDFYRDGAVFLGQATAWPYSISWNSGSATPGSHDLYAVAVDTAGNSATSASIGVTVPVTPPLVSMTSPSNGQTYPRNSTIPLAASITQTSYPVSRVVFLINGVVNCSDQTAPYSCNWRLPKQRNVSYEIHANAYDTGGQVGVSSSVTIRSR